MSSNGSGSLLVVRTQAQWRAILSAVRLELVDAFRRLGPCSIADIAVALDRPADGLYHHLRLLLRAGLLIEAGSRRTHRQNEKLYALAADDLTFDLQLDTRQPYRHFSRLVSLMGATGGRHFSAAARAGVLHDERGTKNWFVRNDLAWLTPNDVRQIRNHIDGILELLDKGRENRTGQLYNLCLIGNPVARSRRAKSRQIVVQKKEI